MAHKSPLRAQRRTAQQTAAPVLGDAESAPLTAVRPLNSTKDERQAVIAELELHLSTTNSKRGRPYQRRTINAYKYAAHQLHNWLPARTSFADVDTATLNKFFRWYYRTHDVPKSQDGRGGYTGGTNTIQRNLRPLFAYLAEEYDVPNPYTADSPKLQRYATPPMGKPKTLSQDFVADCLKITGKNRDFETVRDHAIIRVLTEGLRSEELLSLRVQDLDLQHKVLVVLPLKGDRNSTDGRVIPLQPSTVKALVRYLRFRASHKRASVDDWLWLGTRNRSALKYGGLRRMVKRRAEQAGYDPSEVSPHSYCHTWADDLLTAGVSGEDVMAIRGWKSPAMLRRYASDMASSRAVNAVQKLGDRY
ncbi:site-specific recombinase XerD [Nocardiopsis sp. Huas11]|uniref:tyrosine-type recombinase/integrase n=1 Tax=Nocardiopsis sp. Huas11 TaxID=2183912 RepID=UPI000EADA4F4|nr:site-specific integrase [Nocardiopsis sp. Huas11]RKS06695.1 site-specific recombinase XerD [Nocardiopsis sp. Huas11]